MVAKKAQKYKTFSGIPCMHCKISVFGFMSIDGGGKAEGVVLYINKHTSNCNKVVMGSFLYVFLILIITENVWQ